MNDSINGIFEIILPGGDTLKGTFNGTHNT